MGIFVGCLLAALFVVLLFPSQGVRSDAVIPTTSRPFDSHMSLDAVVEGVLSTAIDSDMEVVGNTTTQLQGSSTNGKRDGAGLPSIADCLVLPSWIKKPMRRLFGPKMDAGVKTRFFLSTRSKRACSEIPTGTNFSASALAGFDPSHRTVVIVHGFLMAGQEVWVRDLTEALLDKVDVNVIAVNWENADGLLKYWKTIANINSTANDMTRFMNQLINEAGLRTDNLHLIGHSFGATICGFVARTLRNVSRITALDPIQPCLKDASMVLDSADASFVDVIHTNGKMLKKFGLGLPHQMGHVEFYPNGGTLVAECQDKMKTTSWKARAWRLIHRTSYKLYERLSVSICTHGRAYVLFTESLRKSAKCFFWGHPWDTHTESVGTVFEQPCEMRHCSEMGYYSDQYPARGSFYLKATDVAPFCVIDQRTDAEMMASGVANLTATTEGNLGP